MQRQKLRWISKGGIFFFSNNSKILMHSLAALTEWNNLGVPAEDLGGGGGRMRGQLTFKLELASQDMDRILDTVGISDFWLFWWQSRQASFVFFFLHCYVQTLNEGRGWWHNLKSRLVTLIRFEALTDFTSQLSLAALRLPVQCLSDGGVRKKKRKLN